MWHSSAGGLNRRIAHQQGNGKRSPVRSRIPPALRGRADSYPGHDHRTAAPGEIVMKKHLVTGIIALALACFGAAPAAGADRADTVIARHIEALGGEDAIRSIRSIMVRSEIEFTGTGMRGTMTTYNLRPCFSFTEISLGLFTIKHGFDGDRIWMIDPNGKLQLRRDEGSRKDQVTTCLLEDYGYLFPGEGGFALTEAGSDTVGGFSCTVLELRPEGGSPCLLYIDASNHLLRRVAIDSRDGRIEQTFGDYRMVSGIAIPFRLRTHHAAMNQTFEIRTDTVLVNASIDPLIFLPPPGDIRDFRFTQGSSAERIPFTYRFRHIYLAALLAGTDGDYNFLLDSGAGMTVIDSALASALDLPFGGTISGVGAGGMADFYMTRIPGLRIQGIEFDGQRVIAFPFSRIARRFTDVEFAGILGYDFLSRFTTTIDYENETISFYEPDSVNAGSNGPAIDAPLVHNVFSITASVNGSHEGTFLLDTGANASMIRRDFVEEHGLADLGELPRIKIIGAGGEEEVALVRFERLEVGGSVIDEPVFAVTSGERGVASFEGISGIIGNDVLERFAVTLDYRSQTVRLERNGRFDEPFFEDRCGLQLTRSADGRAAIVLVVAGSPAEDAGLAPGDVIEAIDGLASAGFASLEEILKLFQGEEGTRRMLTINRSGEKSLVTVTLRRYI